MKKVVFSCLVITALYACSGGGSKDENKPGDNSVDVTKNPDYQKGLGLVAANKCLTCHQIDDKLTGPPYREVANKYGSMPDTIVTHLAKKIISGGNGVWGEIFMTPHPGISQADAETMVKYILLLRK